MGLIINMKQYLLQAKQLSADLLTSGRDCNESQAYRLAFFIPLLPLDNIPTDSSSFTVLSDMSILPSGDSVLAGELQWSVLEL